METGRCGRPTGRHAGVRHGRLTEFRGPRGRRRRRIKGILPFMSRRFPTDLKSESVRIGTPHSRHRRAVESSGGAEEDLAGTLGKKALPHTYQSGRREGASKIEAPIGWNRLNRQGRPPHDFGQAALPALIKQAGNSKKPRNRWSKAQAHVPGIECRRAREDRRPAVSRWAAKERWRGHVVGSPKAFPSRKKLKGADLIRGRPFAIQIDPLRLR